MLYLTDLYVSYTLLLDKIDLMQKESIKPDQSFLNALSELTTATERLKQLLLLKNSSPDNGPYLKLVATVKAEVNSEHAQ
jgi:hypothetical protein